MDWKTMLAYMTGSVDEEFLRRNEYLAAENRILRAHVPGRVTLSDGERRRLPPEIISHAVWLYHRFSLSVRDVEDRLAQRGVTVSYETIRHRCQTFGLDDPRQWRRRRGRLGDTWYLDEVFVTCHGRRQYRWRAVDHDGDVLDILVRRCCTNRHEPARCPPTGSSPADAIRH